MYLKIFNYFAFNSILIVCFGALYTLFIGSPSVRVDQFFELRNMLALLLVMPFVETIIFQVAIIELCKKLFTSGRSMFGVPAWMVLGFLLSPGLFACVHYFSNSEFNGIVYGIPGGICFSLLYMINRHLGAQKAFFSVWVCHVLSNAFTCLQLYLFASVSFI